MNDVRIVGIDGSVVGEKVRIGDSRADVLNQARKYRRMCEYIMDRKQSDFIESLYEAIYDHPYRYPTEKQLYWLKKLYLQVHDKEVSQQAPLVVA